MAEHSTEKRKFFQPHFTENSKMTPYFLSLPRKKLNTQNWKPVGGFKGGGPAPRAQCLWRQERGLLCRTVGMRMARVPTSVPGCRASWVDASH